MKIVAKIRHQNYTNVQIVLPKYAKSVGIFVKNAENTYVMDVIMIIRRIVRNERYLHLSCFHTKKY